MYTQHYPTLYEVKIAYNPWVYISVLFSPLSLLIFPKTFLLISFLQAKGGFSLFFSLFLLSIFIPPAQWFKWWFLRTMGMFKFKLA